MLERRFYKILILEDTDSQLAQSPSLASPGHVLGLKLSDEYNNVRNHLYYLHHVALSMIPNQILTINNIDFLIIEFKKHFADKCWPIT